MSQLGEQSTLSTFSLEKFGVAFGDTVILASVDMEFPQAGITLLVGPCGTGKSTLLRTIVGLNDAQPSLRVWGHISDGLRKAAFVGQHDAKFLLSSIRENLASGLSNRQDLTQREQNTILDEYLDAAGLSDLRATWADPIRTLPLATQRKLAITRQLISDPAILLLDEPTANLPQEDAGVLVEYIKQIALFRAVVVVTHNQQHAKDMDGVISLLAGGRIQEQGTVSDFFANPQTEPGKQFVRTGGCSIPSPNAKQEDLSDDSILPPALPKQSIRPSSNRPGPRDFYWLRRGQLAGMPRPGIVATLDYDLDALVSLGVSVLVTLEESIFFPVSALKENSIEHIFLPIVDMQVPALSSAEQLCRRMCELIGLQRAIAVHCRAGKGRTGTLLACYQIYNGSSAIEALSEVRRINPKWIQSDVQLQFLSDFEEYLRPADTARNRAQ